MRVLGLCAGNPGGSAEILLQGALERRGRRRGATLPGLGSTTSTCRRGRSRPARRHGDDDGPWLWDQLMESDGLIVVGADLLAHRARQAEARRRPAVRPGRRRRLRRELPGHARGGETPPVAFPYDERVFRPRVAGLIAVGGALTSQWKSLALPLMHQMMFSAHIAVADQLLVGGAGMPRAVVLDASALRAAARVGDSVGAQLGRAFDEVQYRGEDGLCPLCHLSVITVAGAAVQCATCGAAGRLAVQDGEAVVRFDDPAGLERSVISLTEKRAHFREVQETAAVQGPLAAEIERRAAAFAGSERRLTPRGQGRRAIA